MDDDMESYGDEDGPDANSQMYGQSGDDDDEDIGVHGDDDDDDDDN